MSAGDIEPTFHEWTAAELRHLSAVERDRILTAAAERAEADYLREEYEFDYRQAKPNRFVSTIRKGGRLVVLEPEIASAFPGSADVNAALRKLLDAVPSPRVEDVAKA